jgi:hypothetical protein
MLARKIMLDCGSDTRKSVLVVALTEPFKDRSDALFNNQMVHKHLTIRAPNIYTMRGKTADAVKRNITAKPPRKQII